MNNRQGVIQAIELGYKTRTGKVLLKDVTVEIASGEVAVIVGPNGAGKTTLLQLLAGLRTPSIGSVLFSGQPLQSLHARKRAQRFAYVGQTSRPNKLFTVNEYVTLGRIPFQGVSSTDKSNHLVAQSLEMTGISHLHQHEMGSLSGGELQRAHLARALCQEPQVLFLDEPTNHLDLRARGDILALIKDIAVTTVLVLHDLSLVGSLADQVILLNQAECVAIGNPDEVINVNQVRTIFGVDLLRIQHPHKPRELTIVDIPLAN